MFRNVALQCLQVEIFPFINLYMSNNFLQGIHFFEFKNKPQKCIFISFINQSATNYLILCWK